MINSISLFHIIICLVPTLWFLGFYVNDISRLILASALLCSIFSHRSRSFFCRRIEDIKKPAMIWQLYLLAFCFLVLIYQISKIYSANVNIDFAIFSQAIDSISRFGVPSVTLVNNQEINYLTHHFSPILYLPGALTYLGIKSYYSGLIIHVIAIALATLVLFMICELLQFSKFVSLLFTLTTLLNPSIRHSLFWGIHPEIYALPFVGLSYFAWLKKKPKLWTISILTTFLAKESYFLFGICWGAIGLICGNKTIKKHSSGIFIFSIICFIAYFFMQPLFWDKNFDHLSKVTSLEKLFNAQSIYQKFKWVIFLFLPVVGLPLLRKQSLLLLIPSLPFLGMVLVSGFPEMYKLFNYYAVEPSYIISITSLYSMKILLREKVKRAEIWWVALPIYLSMSFAGGRPTKDMLINFNGKNHTTNSSLYKIPPELTVIATPSAALFLFHTRKVKRLWLANQVTTEFDLIITEVKENVPISQELLDKSQLCIETEKWDIRCHLSLDENKKKSLQAAFIKAANSMDR